MSTDVILCLFCLFRALFLVADDYRPAGFSSTFYGFIMLELMTSWDWARARSRIDCPGIETFLDIDELDDCYYIFALTNYFFSFAPVPPDAKEIEFLASIAFDLSLACILLINLFLTVSLFSSVLAKISILSESPFVF